MADLTQITEILENMTDQEKAVSLLKRFTELSTKHHKLIMNKSLDLDHGSWEEQCEKSKNDLDLLVEEIFSFKK